MNEPFRLVHADPRFYLIDKAPGVNFHSEDGEAGLLPLLRMGLADDALWPVHRLDKVTSGLILVARSANVANALAERFAAHRIDKFYVALSASKPKKKQGLIRGDMAKGRGGAWKLLHSTENPAVTQFFSTSAGPGVRTFLLRPRTGRTHQLRVALKSVGAPILGDALYGGEAADRTYLHAYALAFELDGEAFNFTCPPSAGAHFNAATLAERLVGEWATPWALQWPSV
ncbi:TIGR01621 family pseudouridine synthase [Crenobacter sp. SG2303]|uniref:TIGR01621 family pseudouridine synthase n=1 Tax=Crenobacter oryzisoli TaxID=3056844 RepID=A0ABT7XJG2_9NEIS|nr:MULTISPECIES: TIGR01621 family pseudouridine synthase [unclassified Crenobacter]MDN0073936.1 TIGR01621 family pseudouridine synthase [Crenobacter sp. SG2303]MDN0083515.1 TIGR01621 family pseudouridine synthase [Crenobacter sp. SG2305]